MKNILDYQTYNFILERKEMKTYQKNGCEYFYDYVNKNWVVYPIDDKGHMIEWDENDNSIEADTFRNKMELNNFFKKTTK